jgi:hypothetical protein
LFKAAKPIYNRLKAKKKTIEMEEEEEAYGEGKN